jgi:hypothetical protein
MKRGAVVLLVAALACRSSTPSELTTCATATNYALRIKLADSITAARVPFFDVSAVAVDGTYRDSVHVDSLLDPAAANVIGGIGIAFDRSGIYAVTVTARGYARWTKSGVNTPTHRLCINGTDTLTIRLRKL